MSPHRINLILIQPIRNNYESKSFWIRIDVSGQQILLPEKCLPTKRVCLIRNKTSLKKSEEAASCNLIMLTLRQKYLETMPSRARASRRPCWPTKWMLRDPSTHSGSSQFSGQAWLALCQRCSLTCLLSCSSSH